MHAQPGRGSRANHGTRRQLCCRPPHRYDRPATSRQKRKVLGLKMRRRHASDGRGESLALVAVKFRRRFERPQTRAKGRDGKETLDRRGKLFPEAR